MLARRCDHARQKPSITKKKNGDENEADISSERIKVLDDLFLPRMTPADVYSHKVILKGTSGQTKLGS